MRCERAFCLRRATTRIRMLNPAGDPETEDQYCGEHAAELTSVLIPTYHDGKPAFTTEAIAS